VRTTGYYPPHSIITGGQYTLAGAFTGTQYTLNAPGHTYATYDATTDGTYNYFVDSFGSGNVYRADRDYTNATVIFNLGFQTSFIGITYDPTHRSLWFSGWLSTTISQYSLTGTLLSSFDTAHRSNAALAFDPADQTLWLVNNEFDPMRLGEVGLLEQYSLSGALLSTGPETLYTYGGEFNMVPEPATLILTALSLAGILLSSRKRVRDS
jgi:hypothetical protein